MGAEKVFLHFFLKTRIVKIVMKYSIPQKLITSFLEHSVNNFSTHGGQHIETLAFLVGKKDGNEVEATDIIFPQQTGSSVLCEDMGK